MNNDFGKAYDVGFKAYLAQSPNKDKIEYVTETIEPQAPTITDAMTTLAAKNPEMFIAMVAGTPCTQAIIEAAQNGMKETAKYLHGRVGLQGLDASSARTRSAATAPTAGGSSAAASGTSTRPVEDGTPWIVWARDTLQAAGFDSKALRQPRLRHVRRLGLGAGPEDRRRARRRAHPHQPHGGRPRAMDMTHPVYLEGIKFNLNGNKDAYWIEGTEVGKYDFSRAGLRPAGRHHRAVGQVRELRLGPGSRHLQVT